jgi:hypothetical protein
MWCAWKAGSSGVSSAAKFPKLQDDLLKTSLSKIILLPTTQVKYTCNNGIRGEVVNLISAFI